MTILAVNTGWQEGLAHVVLEGELDLSSVERAEDELRAVEADDPETMVLDLAGLTFLDSTGLRLVVTADQRARRAGRRLVIVKGPETVQRVFTITRLDERLDMVDDAAALGGV